MKQTLYLILYVAILVIVGCTGKGIHDDNPPYDDQYNYDYPDPNYYDIVGSK